MGGFGAPPYEARETKVFSPLEHERVRLVCALDPANYDAGRSPIYAVFLSKGRSMIKVEAVLQKFLAPAPNNWDPISVYASQELVRYMKDLKFGWGNENTHDKCHRGILPFTVLQVSTDNKQNVARPRNGQIVPPICPPPMTSGRWKPSWATALHLTTGC